MTMGKAPHQRKQIAVIGAGISGLTAAYLLNPHHGIQVFEANDYIGGHTHTESVALNGVTYPVNTGFIVFNDWTYPNFNRLLKHLGVVRQPTDMSFSVRCDRTGLEYCGSSLNTLFAQRRNLIRPSFLWMVADILRFFKQAQQDMPRLELSMELSLQQYLQQQCYGKAFIQHYILPMGAAIWSASPAQILQFPAYFFIRFFHNHGLLSLKNRPQWYVFSQGSQAYIPALTRSFKQHIHVSTAIKRVERFADYVQLTDQHQRQYRFDEVIFACHSDQALQLLAQPTELECNLLAAMPYAENEVVLHTDTRLLPKSKRAWAAWNYHLHSDASAPAAVTYNMNRLQNFTTAPETFCVTLNNTGAIDPQKIIRTYRYSHPQFSVDSQVAQMHFKQISQQQHTHYCGAYWFNGFHEDGVNSAIRVARCLGGDFVK